jgi:hypothetical protein
VWWFFDDVTLTDVKTGFTICVQFVAGVRTIIDVDFVKQQLLNQLRFVFNLMCITNFLSGLKFKATGMSIWCTMFHAERIELKNKMVHLLKLQSLVSSPLRGEK